MEYQYFLVRCKKCGHDMKYMTKDPISSLNDKKKRCVYCGHSFSVGKSIKNESQR